MDMAVVTHIVKILVAYILFKVIGIHLSFPRMDSVVLMDHQEVIWKKLYVRSVLKIDIQQIFTGIDLLTIMCQCQEALKKVKGQEQLTLKTLKVTSPQNFGDCVKYMTLAYFSTSETSYYSGISIYTRGSTFMANIEGPADDGWYLDSGVTHQLTNNMENMHIREQFKGND